MSKPASDATLLRHEKARVKVLQKDLEDTKKASAAYRARATTAEQELAEWKRRFDELLKIVPKP